MPSSLRATSFALSPDRPQPRTARLHRPSLDHLGHKPRLREGLLLAVATIAATAATVSGQTPADSSRVPTVSMAQAVERALSQHPSLTAATAATAEARAQLAQASAARLPSVALTGSVNRYEQPMLVTPIHGFSQGALPPFDRTLYQGAATASWTLFDGGAREARIRRGREGTAAATAGEAVAANLLVARTATTYTQVLARAQVAAAHEARITALEVELRNARQRLDAGRAARVEVLRAEAALEAARADRVHAVEALDLAERDLAQLTGSPVEQVRAGQLAPAAITATTLPPRDELLARARDRNPALERARRQHELARAGIAIARAARLPEVKLGGAWVERGSAGTQSWGEWNAGASLAVPLFTGGAISADVDRARAATRNAEAQLRTAELQLEQDLDRARAAAAEAAAREASLATAATRYAEVARIQRLALDAGSATQADYLAAESDLLLARASRAEALLNAFAARVELARVTGELSPAWLAAALETRP